MHYSTKIVELGSVAFRQWRSTTHCKYIHGYQLKAKITMSAEKLDSCNWVYDFGKYKEITSELKSTFDHHLVLSADDPLLEGFKQLEAAGGAQLTILQAVGIEKFAEYVHGVVARHIKAASVDVNVASVEVFELELNSAIYSPDIDTAFDVDQYRKQLETASLAHMNKQIGSKDDNSGVVTELKLENKEQTISSKPAPVGNVNTTGWFSGTSWG